ncbi:Crp/Fnr family transcriptional regulator [Paenibacillus pasadenensis]|uniref:Crp/Fnr family transcriptional regulator n=1 Tax=Paenibacillus pasadenensis TaxID=217090 RepID=UPI00203D9E50|nr:Crp/Fnr family transcriptional regulator [Paenibacillus pasadenensis]MCM3748608.1 Crp/Fnr family transcriptional regulator [Paenibacillus pasadenensis]
MAMKQPMERSAYHDKSSLETEQTGFSAFFTEEQWKSIQGLMSERRAEAGHFLFWEGEAADKLIFVLSGKVKLRKSTEDGKEFILSILQSGDLIGGPEAGRHSVYGFSAEVAEEATIGVLPWMDLEKLLMASGELAMRWMNGMALQQRIAESKFRDLLLYGKPGALASTLIRLANSYGVLRKDGMEIGLRLTNAELAEFIGTTRESVNRMLASMKDDGIITVRNGLITIVDQAALRRICGCPQCPACPKEVCRI